MGAEVAGFAHSMRRTMESMEVNDFIRAQDTSKDRKLTLDEFLGDAHSITQAEKDEKVLEFKDLDTNSDKLLDTDELAHLFHRHINDNVEASLTGITLREK